MSRFAAAVLSVALLLAGCRHESGEALITRRFATQARKITATPGFARTEAGFARSYRAEAPGAAAHAADPALPADPVRAAEAALTRRADGLELSLPERGSDAAVLTFPRLRVELRELGLHGAGELAGTAVTYPRTGGAAYWAAGRDHVEEWILAEAAGEGPVAEWEVGGATLRQRGAAVELLDAGGVARARVTAPVAWREDGSEAHAWLRVEEGRLALYTAGRGAVLVDPVWQSVSSPGSNHLYGEVTMLPTGKVLLTGPGTAAETYDPWSGIWSSVAPMPSGHSNGSATLLQDGRVLVVGGTEWPLGADLFDPRTGTWTTAGSMSLWRAYHSATLLPNGKVLVAGGAYGATIRPDAEIFDPVTGQWAPAQPMSAGRYWHTATMLGNGRVLVTGGGVATAETYDPITGLWSGTGALPVAKSAHIAVTLPSGKVLIAGASGSGDSTVFLYDYVAGAFQQTATLSVQAGFPAAALLPNGYPFFRGYDAGQLFDPASSTWSSAGSPPTIFGYSYPPLAVVLPTGQLLIEGNVYSTSPAPAEIYDSAAATSSPAPGTLTAARSSHTSTLLRTGQVLVAGGLDGAGAATRSAELFDPATGLFSTTGNLVGARAQHTATTLPSGKVLLSGGTAAGAPLASAELYDPVAGTFQATTGPMAAARTQQTATLLGTGKVLVTGGLGAAGPLLTAELFDPGAGTWASTGALGAARSQHAALLMPTGLVLVMGGLGAAGALASVERYDPSTGLFSALQPITGARYAAAVSLLPSGGVIIVGGQGSAGLLASAEFLSNGLGSSWSATGSLSQARAQHTATLLPSGKVLVAGGLSAGGASGSTDLYDPLSGVWTPLLALGTARSSHSATLLPSGKALLAGGLGAAALASAELFDEGRGAAPARIPVVTGASSAAGPSTVVADAPLTLTGTVFTGTCEASDGRRSSSANNFPLVTLERADGGPPVVAPLTAFTATSAIAKVPSTLLPGPYWARVTVSGIPSNVVFVTVTPPLAISPASPSAPPKGTLAFTTTGGSGSGVTWTTTASPSGGSIGPGTGIYVAGATGNQIDIIQARDSLGNLAATTVNVTPQPTILPATVSLPPRGTQTFTFTGGSGVLARWDLSSKPSGGTINPSTGAYQAGNTGNVTDTVLVTDSLGNTASRSVAVTAPPAIAPGTASTYPKGAVALTASGGSGTGYTWQVTVDSSGGAAVVGTGATAATYTAGASGPANDVVSLTDGLGNVTTRTISVTASLAISPASWSLAPSATKAFTASGGSGTGFTWSIPVKGSGSPSFNPTSGATVTYQAGLTGASADQIQVSDSAGNVATAPVTITAGLSISPASATVQTGLTQSFTPSGGSGLSYQWTMGTTGSVTGSIVSTTGLYTAGSTAGTDVIRLSDSLGNTRTATITVVAPVTFSPSPASAPPRGSITFVPAGGAGAPFTFTPKTPPLASGGSLTTGGVYTAGPTPSVTDVLQLADAAGVTATINVAVGPGISVTPAAPSAAAPLGAIAFGATGGKGAPFSWVLFPKPSGGSIDPLTGAYKAGSIGGVTDTVTVSDTLGNSATRTVAVSAPPAVTPGDVTLQVGKSQAFTASLGAGGFTWTLAPPALGTWTPTSGATTTYTAPASAGTDTLQATDANGFVVSRVITVVPTLTVATLPASAPPRGALDFTGVGGAGAPYTFSPTTTPLPSGGSVTSAGHYLAGATPSVTDVLRVTDALGATTSFNVTVTAGVAILPAGASSTWPKGALTFTAAPAGGSGTGYSFAPVTMNSGGSIDATGHYLAGATGGVTDTIQLTDSLGNAATRLITVGPAPTLSPAPFSVAPGGTRALTAAGGSGTFPSWAVLPATAGAVAPASGAAVTFTAGTTPGNSQVQATDSAGNVASAAVTVLAPLAIGPGPVSLPPRGAQQFTASGGSTGGTGYQWALTSKPSGGSVNPATGAYLAGSTGGVVDTLQLTDGIGTTTTINITVTAGLSVNPASLTTWSGGTQAFTAAGGAGEPYTWAYATGGNASGGSLVVGAYTAGSLTDVTDTFVVSDLLGNSATVAVWVSSAVVVWPGTPSTPPGGAISFSAGGGAGPPFSWRLSVNNSTGSIDPLTGAYLAGAKGSVTDTVEVTDSASHTATTTVTVTAGPTIAPSAPTTSPRGSITFSATGGSGAGYAWTMASSGSGGAIDPVTGVYVAGARGGVTDQVKVEDSLHNTALRTITVTPGVSIRTGGTTLLVRETAALTAQGGSATGWTWTLGTNASGASLTGTGATRTYIAGGVGGVTDVVTVTDSLGNGATVSFQVRKSDPLSCGNTAGLPSALGLVGVGLLLARRRRARPRPPALHRSLPALAAALLLWPALAGAAPKGSARTAVLDLVADSGVEARVARVATDTLVAELQAVAGVPVITERDIRTGMGFEQRKAIACTSKEENCLLELGGALGVDFLVFGSIARLDDTYVVSVSAFDERRAVVVRRFQQRSKGIGEAGVLDLLEEAGRALAPVLPGSRAVESPRSPPPVALGPSPPVAQPPPGGSPGPSQPAQVAATPAFPAPAATKPSPPAAPPPPPVEEKLEEEVPPPPPEGFLVVLRAARPTDGPGFLGGVELGWRPSDWFDFTAGGVATGQRLYGVTGRATGYLVNPHGHVRLSLSAGAVRLLGAQGGSGFIGSVGLELRGQRSGFVIELPLMSLFGSHADSRTSWLLAGVAITWRP
jgi:hypothetical protein